jgi:hypothetical protein
MTVTFVTELCPERYWKRLVGKTDMEDALKKLDNLTQEESWVMIAEIRKAIYAVDKRVKGVDDRVAEDIHGMQISSDDPETVCLTLNCSDRREVMKQVERLSSHNLIDIGHGRLIHHFRRPIAGEYPQMAFHTRSVNKPQHCMWYPSQESCNVVLQRKHLPGMEIKSFAHVDPRKACALSQFSIRYDDDLIL